jgi:hypothetical protein
MKKLNKELEIVLNDYKNEKISIEQATERYNSIFIEFKKNINCDPNIKLNLELKFSLLLRKLHSKKSILEDLNSNQLLYNELRKELGLDFT